MRVSRSDRFSAAMVTAVVLCTAAGLSAQTRPSVAVLAFENNTTISFFADRLGLAAADELITQLVRTGEFTVIERQRIDEILGEQRLGTSGVVDPATAARIGRLLGAQAVIVGSITQFSLESRSVGISRLDAWRTPKSGVVQAVFQDTSARLTSAIPMRLSSPQSIDNEQDGRAMSDRHSCCPVPVSRNDPRVDGQGRGKVRRRAPARQSISLSPDRASVPAWRGPSR